MKKGTELRKQIKKIYFHGKFYRLRFIGEISDLYQGVLGKRGKNRDVWSLWYKECTKIKNFWGYRDSEKEVFKFQKDSFSHRVVENKEDFVLTSKFEDIPLMIAQPGVKRKGQSIIQPDLTSCIPLMSNILSGRQKLYPKKQAFVDRFSKIETRFQRIWRVTEFYQKMIIKCVGDNFGGYLPKVYSGENLIITLNIKGHIYHIYCESSNMKIIDNSNIKDFHLDPKIIVGSQLI